MMSPHFLTTLLAISFAQWALYITCLKPVRDIRENMAPSTVGPQAAYAKAVKRCRKQHKFFFLDLPQTVRRRSYSHLFNDHTFIVCSFDKDRSLLARDEWPATARAQILCTCREIFKEAVQPLYWHTNWQFTTASSLSYFTWYDVSAKRLSSVARITLSSLDALEEFEKAAHRVNDLRTLVVDAGHRLDRWAPLPASHYDSFIRRIKNSPVYQRAILPHTIDSIPPKCCLIVVVKLIVTFPRGRITHEMIAVNIDREQVHRKYRPVTEEEALEYLEMPSAGDTDVLHN